jgi:hypothetical protein
MEWESQFGRNLWRADGQGSVNLNHVWSVMWKSNLPAKKFTKIHGSAYTIFRRALEL